MGEQSDTLRPIIANLVLFECFTILNFPFVSFASRARKSVSTTDTEAGPASEDIGPKSYRRVERTTSIFVIEKTKIERDDQMNIETQIRSVGLKDSFSATTTRAGGRRAIPRAKKANTPSNGTVTTPTQSPNAAKSSPRYSIGMFSAGEARCDRWQEMAHAGQTLVAQSSSPVSRESPIGSRRRSSPAPIVVL